jgi:hypothetical protein
MKAMSRTIVLRETSRAAASLVQLVNAPRRSSSWIRSIRSIGGRDVWYGAGIVGAQQVLLAGTSYVPPGW